MLHSLGPKSLRHGESNQDEMVGQSDSPAANTASAKHSEAEGSGR